MILLCLESHNNVFLANRVKCWNLFTHSTKSSDSCFTIIYIRFVIQWPWVYNIFLFEWVHPENNVHQTEWSADGCIVIDKEWYYVYSYKLSQIAQQSHYYYSQKVRAIDELSHRTINGHQQTFYEDTYKEMLYCYWCIVMDQNTLLLPTITTIFQ